MLDPKYLQTVTDELENYFYDLETDILADIAERIRLNAGNMTSTAQYQLEQLKALGVVDNRVNSYLSKALKKSNKEVEKLISESAYKSVEADNVIFKEAYDKKLIASFSYNKNDFKDLIAKGVAATTKDIKNICNTTAKTSRQKLTSAMNMAYLQVSSGAFSPDQVVENAVSQLVKEGLDWIDYKSGTHRHLDTSIRQALRTSINQTALKCQDQNFEALGGNLVEVSSHLGARPSHSQWQGKIYWRKEQYKNYSNFEEATGYGTITGLGGVNCRHSFFPYFPGLSTKSFEHYSQKENEELYNLQQEQRYNERKIREWKRRQKVKSSAGLDTSKESAKVREWSQRNKKLIDSDSRLKKNYGREMVYLSRKDGIIDISSIKIAGALDPDSKRASTHAIQYYESVRKMKTDYIKIAKNTGIEIDEIKRIKNYLFVDEHELLTGKKRFDPSYQISESWRRLIDGKNIQKHDLTLLKHEILERNLILSGLSQDEAHIQASKKYNYNKEASEYYVKINKRKKK